MKLLYQQRSYHFRSPGLRKFLQLLQDAYPNWVDMAKVEQHFPAIHPRQLARFIDTLEAENLPLVLCETKTRGRFRLAVEPSQFSMLEDLGRVGKVIPPAKPLLLTTTPLSVYEDAHWVHWVIALLHANLALHDGCFLDEHGALDYLNQAETATTTLPAWTQSVVYVRRAFVLTKIGRFREATHWLRRVETAIRHGHAHPAAQARMQFVWAKMRYDQMRYDDAERFLASTITLDDTHCPHWLNMSSLIAGRKFLAADALNAPYFLTQTLERMTEAFGAVFLWHGDSSLLDGLSYNFANNLLRGVRRGLLPKEGINTVMQWLVANMQICRKLGIGEDSVLTNLLLLEVLLEYGGAFTTLPELVRNELDTVGGLAGLLEHSLAHARKISNMREVVQCLQLKLQLPISPAQAETVYLEAWKLLQKRGEEKQLNELAATWRKQFGLPPPELESTDQNR